MAVRAADPGLDGNLNELQLKAFRILNDGTVSMSLTNPDGTYLNSTTGTISSTSANALAVGPNGTTNPTLQVDGSVSSEATGVKITGAAAGSGVTVAAISSGTNENLTVNAKGTGTLNLNATHGFSVFGGNVGVDSTSANALSVGPADVTNPTFNVDSSTASVATGLNVKGAAAASGLAVSTISSGTNENLTIDAKGSGTITLNGTATGAVISGQGLFSNNATAGNGYSTGAGGTVTQGTSRTTGVTLNKVCGAITLVSAAGSATPFTFTVTNSAVAATDTVIVSQKSGTDAYSAVVSAVAAGSFKITVTDLTGTTTEQPVFNFAVTKAVSA